KTKAKKIMRSAPKLSLETTISEASRLMIENNLFNLPVFDKQKLVGVLHGDDLIEYSLNQVKDVAVEQIMTTDTVTANQNDSIANVMILFREHNISRLPITDGQKLIGIISLKD